VIRHIAYLLIIALSIPFLPCAAIAGDTLDAVRLRDEMVCGVSTGLPGFSMPNDDGEWEGLDADMCRAVAAAVLGDADKVSFVPLNSKDRFKALQTGEIDVLIRNSTWTFSRDTELDVTFVGVNYYDGQGFMVNRNLGVNSVDDLTNASICMQSGTTTEMNIKAYFKLKGMDYTLVPYNTSDQTAVGFQSGRCNVLSSDQSQLFALRHRMADPDLGVILPEVISKEPLGPAVRKDDKEWLKIVQWTLFALINAEELGVSSKNAAQLRRSNKPEIQWLLGTHGNLGDQMGLEYNWAFNAIRQVGNYGEIFERNVGSKSPLNIKRGMNALWKDGGIMYAPPIR